MVNPFATLQKGGECFGCIGIHSFYSFYAAVLQIAKRGSLLALDHTFSLAICKQSLLTFAQVALLSLCRFYQVLQGWLRPESSYLYLTARGAPFIWRRRIKFRYDDVTCRHDEAGVRHNRSHLTACVWSAFYLETSDEVQI